MKSWRISVDTGGTFTDCIAESPDGIKYASKVLSSGRIPFEVQDVVKNVIIPEKSLELPKDVIRKSRLLFHGKHIGTVEDFHENPERIYLGKSFNHPISKGDLLELETGEPAPVLAMRKILGPLSSRPHLKFRLGTTKATNSLLEGKIAPVLLILSEGFEDLIRIGNQTRPELFARGIAPRALLYKSVMGVGGRIDSHGVEQSPVELSDLLDALQKHSDCGCTTAVICLKNSFRNSLHEDAVARVLKSAGFSRIIKSSAYFPFVNYLQRTETALIDGCLEDILEEYLDRVEACLKGNSFEIMTSSGGLVARQHFRPVHSLVSGPAGGIRGAVAVGRQCGLSRILTLDMGGTSTDVSRWAGKAPLKATVAVGQAVLRSPSLHIETVAAGGGSICSFENGELRVGPESAGAEPGPACYGRGGPLTLTDVNLLAGRLDPSAFQIPIYPEKAKEKLKNLKDESGISNDSVLLDGLLSIANLKMANAIRQVSVREGADPKDYGLVTFGGAGGLHACRIANRLGINEILWPENAGLLSAEGIHASRREMVVAKQLLQEIGPEIIDFKGIFREMRAEALEGFKNEDFDEELLIVAERSLAVRIMGQESSLQIDWNEEIILREEFQLLHRATFGYTVENPDLEIVSVRLILAEKEVIRADEFFSRSSCKGDRNTTVKTDESNAVYKMRREDLTEGDSLRGPAIVADQFGTFFVESGWEAELGNRKTLRVKPAQSENNKLANYENQADPIESVLVRHRLQAIVDEMGNQLQRTALSTNIRERLDYSCGLLDSGGKLLINAPHIPVHLGALGECVRRCLVDFRLGEGDVLVTNHPGYGGSHLPDVTMIVAVLDREGKPIGYLANRAHHAEIGGTRPGSMPPDASKLFQEGVILEPQFIVKSGESRFDVIEKKLRNAKYPSRSIRENLIDFSAQIASLKKGSQMFSELLESISGERLKWHFGEILYRGKKAVADYFTAHEYPQLEVKEELDDGTQIRALISQNGDGLCIDFTGTSEIHGGNLNATPAIVKSAVLYVMRLLINEDMPLNEGLLDLVEIKLPVSFLNPSFNLEEELLPAVVGGNVETSQRLVDGLIAAFEIMAMGQGTMNNLLFGNDRFGYYETIGGGAGAGEGFEGASGVHVHMTNTSITDVEILEQRFPVECRCFSIRKDSGGKGRYSGGNGIIREIIFLESMRVSFMSEHRINAPRGCLGGRDGLLGNQWKRTQDGRLVAMPGRFAADLEPGEGVRIETPGGGGWGKVPS